MKRPLWTVLVAGAATVAALAFTGGAGAIPADATTTTAGAAKTIGGSLSGRDRTVLMRYAKDTWTSMVAMVDPTTGLPADNINGDLSAGSRSGYTSPTNIGGYLWSAIAARDLGIISRYESDRRIKQTLAGLAALDRHDDSGMFYNWYDPHTGDVLHVWPEDGSTVYPFLSSVDNGWLGAALLVVRNAVPAASAQADALLRGMNFGFYYNPDAKGPGLPGLIRGGFWDTEPPGCSVVGNYPGHGADVWYTCNHYDITVTEPRIATYLGIAFGQIPREAYFATWRTLPDTCDYNWQEQQPKGFNATHLGVPVFEGSYEYRGVKFVPSWGGDMFEALMPNLFVPEEVWGPRSWGRNHPAIVRTQIEHGLDDAKYGYWGFSPASNPFGGYSAWGVEATGMDTNGYPSDVEGTTVTPAYADCREASPPPASYGDGVVTPHAVFLALRYAPHASMENLANLRHDFDAYGPGGFYDAIAVRSGTVAKRYLALDQGMELGAIGNALRGDDIRRAFVRGPVEHRIKPLLGIEEFNIPAHQ